LTEDTAPAGSEVMLPRPGVGALIDLDWNLGKGKRKTSPRLQFVAILTRMGGALTETDVLDQIHIAGRRQLTGHHAGEHQLAIPGIHLLAGKKFEGATPIRGARN
jgi:hypothetical protein